MAEQDDVRIKQYNLAKTIKKIWSNYNYIIIFLGIFIAFIIINGRETTWTSITNILLHSAILGTIALGMGLIILTGDIDLSVGSSFVLIGGLTIIFYNYIGNIILTLVFAVILGFICGFINGFLISKWDMPSFIVTLATMLIFRSISQYMMNKMGETRYRIDASKGSYQDLFNFGNGRIATIGNIVIVFAILAALMIYITTSTKFGKHVFAIGSNEKAAKLAGVKLYGLV